MLLPPVAYAVFLLEWQGVTLISLLMIGFLAVNAYRWQGLTYVLFAGVAFSFAVLFTLVFNLLAVHSERARNQVQQLASELEAANQRLREYAVAAEELAVARERNRIAREIHDSLGHYLTVVNVQIEAARALELSEPKRARGALAKAQAFTHEGLQDIRRSLAALRASPLDNKPLADALRDLVSASQGAGLPTAFELRGTPRRLASPAELSLYRAVQEGLTNARKHAQAKHVRVTLDFRGCDRAAVTVQDDGIGAAPGKANDGFGLLGLALTVYVQENEDRLPACAGYLPSQMPNLPSITATLFSASKTNQVFRCPADRKIFPEEHTSYEWNFWLNDAPYSAPQWATIFTNEARVIVDTLFGGRDETPILGDADAYHGARGKWLGKNALYFDGRAQHALMP